MNMIETPSRRSRALVVLCLTALSAAVFGGCSNKEKQQEVMLADLTQENEQLREENQKMGDELSSARTRLTEVENENATLKSQPAQSPAAAEGVAMRGGDRVLTIAGDVAFNSGSTTLTSAGKREVDKIINIIQSQYAGHRVEIAGFTDSDPLRKTREKYTDNENLSAQRALAVERYMNSKGIPGDITHIAGYGPSNPKGSKKDSRRVEIKILAN